MTEFILQTSQMSSEITSSKSHLRTLQNEFIRLRSDLQFRLHCIDFAYISAIFLNNNDNLLKTHDSVQ